MDVTEGNLCKGSRRGNEWGLLGLDVEGVPGKFVTSGEGGDGGGGMAW